MESYKSINDFLLDESFINYALQINDTDIAKWEEYIKVNPKKKELFEQAKVAILDMQIALSAVEAEENFQKLKPLLEKKTKNIPKRFSTFQYVAASVAIFLISTISILYFIHNSHHTEITYSTKPSQRKTITLSDGTLIKLNADSRLEVVEGFGKTNREIKLMGEAYIEVVKDKNLPFIIGTHSLTVRVLGTTLNIRAYPNEDHAEASLVEGSAEVILKSKEVAPILLKPMNKVVTIATEQPFRSQDIPVEVLENTEFQLESMTHYDNQQKLVETSWTEQKLVFVNESLSSIAKTLERWYNIEIKFEREDIRSRKYTAAFDESEELQSVLESLKASIPFDYKKTGKRTITIN